MGQLGKREPFAIQYSGRWVGKYYDADGTLRSAAYANTRKAAEKSARLLQEQSHSQRALCNKFNLMKL